MTRQSVQTEVITNNSSNVNNNKQISATPMSMITACPPLSLTLDESKGLWQCPFCFVYRHFLSFAVLFPHISLVIDSPPRILTRSHNVHRLLSWSLPALCRRWLHWRRLAYVVLPSAETHIIPQRPQPLVWMPHRRCVSCERCVSVRGLKRV